MLAWMVWTSSNWKRHASRKNTTQFPHGKSTGWKEFSPKISTLDAYVYKQEALGM